MRYSTMSREYPSVELTTFVSVHESIGSINVVSYVREPSNPAFEGATTRDHVAPEVGAHRCLARCRITMLESTTKSIGANTTRKGDVLATARVAGIQAARQAVALLPMSYPAPTSGAYVNFTITNTHVDIETSVDALDRTGVEMAALTAATVAALTIYDMCKSADHTMIIGEVALWERSENDGGTWRRRDTPNTASGEATKA